MKEEKNIAILLFARSGKAESRHKDWFKNQPKQNNRLSQWLTAHAKQQLTCKGLPVFHFSEKEQEGETFGQRLANAFQALFNSGYKAVIAVGNDCIGLAQLPWQFIQEALLSERNVIGPNMRGGAYLIGIQSQNFQAESFEYLSWQSPQLQKELLAFCGRDCLLLQTLRDLNTAQDLAYFINETENKALIIILSELFGSVCQNNATPYFFFPNELLSELSNRPPPLRAA